MVATYQRPRNERDLYFSDAPPGEAAYFTHDFGAYRLEARILYNAEHAQPWAYYIHGARADYTKANVIAFGLAKRGISLLGGNLSGHNKASPLPLEETSLAHNIREAEAFYQYVDPERPKTLIAFSLGATPALKILEKHISEINKVILFGPTLYDKDAYDKPFGRPFREAITRPFSYRDTDVLSILNRFAGRLLVVKGEYDGLESVEAGRSAGEVEIAGKKYYSPVPHEVFSMIMAAVSPEDRKELIEIPGGDHSVFGWDASLVQALLDRIAAFIKDA